MKLCNSDKIGFFDAANILYKNDEENSDIRNQCYQIIYGSSGRMYLNSIALDEVKANRLFGMGVYGYQKKYKTYPHNVFTECIADGGIIVGVLFMLLFLATVIYLLRLSCRDIQYAAITAFIVALLIRAFFNGNLYTSCDLILLFTCAYSIKIKMKKR